MASVNKESLREEFGALQGRFAQLSADGKMYALNLLIAQMLSLKRVQQSLATLLGQVICEATILKYLLLLHLALEQWGKTAIERLLTLPALHVDETSLRVDKKNQCIHVCSGGEITLKFLHEKRGQEAMQAIGVIPRYGGVIVHDCWACYLAYEHCGHDPRRTGTAAAPCPTKRQARQKSSVLLCARDPHVAFTNNRAERDLRMSKVKQKVSGCFRKPQYAEAYCRICSFLQTMANRGYNPLLAIQLALSGQLYQETGK